MPKFIYSARNSAGDKLSGSEDAVSSEELIERLQGRGLFVLAVNIMGDKGVSDVNDLKPKGSKQRMQRQHSSITASDLMIFSRQLATLLNAGINILKSLQIVAQQVSSRKLNTVIKSVIKDMEAGMSFHQALAMHPIIFSELWVNLIESGEASGNLAVVLNRLASYLERQEAFKSKIISSLIYPAILLLAGTGALLFLTIKIIPTFAEIFKGFNIELPFLTVMLIAVSDFVRKSFLIILGIIIAGIFIFKKYVKTKSGRRKFENFQYNLPMFADFFRALAVERFSSTMTTLIESGVPLLYSLDITEHSVGSLTVGDIVRKIKEDVRDGKSLSQPLAESGFFEPMVVQMVAVGEEVGDLPQMFKRINNFYQEQVETFLTRFTSMFEPLMLLFMGGVIGMMVVGMFLPIFQLTQMK